MFWVVINVSSGEDINRGIKAIPRKEQPTSYFTNERLANEDAAGKARMTPGTDYAVMKVSKVFSTGTPKIITKVCNEAGELVVEKPSV